MLIQIYQKYHEHNTAKITQQCNKTYTHTHIHIYSKNTYTCKLLMYKCICRI